jgi:hypothetical protein
MGLDIRLPIGWMFTILGVLIGGYGLVTRGSAIYVRHSLGININLWWGMALVIFGLTILLLSRIKAGGPR